MKKKKLKAELSKTKKKLGEVKAQLKKVKPVSTVEPKREAVTPAVKDKPKPTAGTPARSRSGTTPKAAPKPKTT